jgi:hypothetical protein
MIIGLEELRSSGRYGLAESPPPRSSTMRHVGWTVTSTRPPPGSAPTRTRGPHSKRALATVSRAQARATSRRSKKPLSPATPRRLLAPDFQQAIEGTAACLNGYIAEAPDDLFDMSSTLTSLTAERARDAYIG